MTDDLIVGKHGFIVVPEGTEIVDDSGRLAIVRALAAGAVVTVESMNKSSLTGQALDPLGGTLHGSFKKVAAVTGDLIVYPRY